MTGGCFLCTDIIHNQICWLFSLLILLISCCRLAALVGVHLTLWSWPTFYITYSERERNGEFYSSREKESVKQAVWSCSTIISYFSPSVEELLWGHYGISMREATCLHTVHQESHSEEPLLLIFPPSCHFLKVVDWIYPVELLISHHWNIFQVIGNRNDLDWLHFRRYESMQSCHSFWTIREGRQLSYSR